MNLLEKVAAYANGARILSEWLGSGSNVADPSVAQKRAYACIQCPRNVSHWKAPEAVANAIREQVGLKNDLALVVKDEDKLHTCEVCLCVNRLKIWLPLASLTKYMVDADFQDYPSNCWLRTELNK